MNELQTLFDDHDMTRSLRMSLKLIRIARLKQFAVSRRIEGPVAMGLAINKKPNQTSDLLSGKASFGEKVARSIEEYAGLPINWLDQVDGEQNTTFAPAFRAFVPLLSNAQAGMYKEVIDNETHGSSAFEQIPTSTPIRKHTFALYVVGDSMEPEFREGMTLIIEPDIKAESGDYVIVKTGDAETTFKQLVKDGPDWYLKPLNDRYPIKLLGDLVIIGVVRDAVKHYR